MENNCICNICLDEMTKFTKMTTECGHHFHNYCLYSWAKKKETCPTCRTGIDISGKKIEVIKQTEETIPENLTEEEYMIMLQFQEY